MEITVIVGFKRVENSSWN